MAEYTSSPLGLINPNSIQKYSVSETGDVQSIFSSKHILRRQPNDKPFGRGPLSFDSPSIIHTSDIYDIKTSSLVEKLKDIPGMRLKYSDFAYCKNFGVYPNNRLMICRRFPNFIGDEITGSDTPEANATLITWFSDDNYPLDFVFGEEWTEAEASFKNVLNSVGKDIVISALGDFAGSAINAVPLPGITEVLQRKVLESLGIISPNSASKLPAGDPNLIKEAKQRRLVEVDSKGSGVVGKFRVRVKCAWEQKYLNGVDPTFVYYDILRTILSFGGSDATFYLGRNQGLNDGMKRALNNLENNPFQLITDTINSLTSEIDKIKESLRKFFSKDPADTKSLANEENNPLNNGTALSSLESATKYLTQTIALKYKIPILGIVSALTGLPSTPWHITLGNPLRPIFCSGDMLCTDVNVNLGAQLSFNDLPTYVECEFVLESARNLGVDEIFNKLSSSQIRVVDGDKFKSLSVSPDSFTNNDNPTKDSLAKLRESERAHTQSILDNRTRSQEDGSEQSEGSIVPNINQTKVGFENGQSINPDPYGNESIR